MSRIIEQLTKDNVFIKLFPNTKTASNELKICYNGISRVLRKKQETAGNYKWIFHTYIVDGENERKKGVVDGVDVEITNLGRIDINGKITNSNGKIRAQIWINGNKYLVSRILYTIWNGLSLNDLPPEHYIVRKDGITTDYKPDNLELNKCSNGGGGLSSSKPKPKARSKTVELIEYDDNNDEIVLYEYSSAGAASALSSQHIGEARSRSYVSTRCNDLNTIIIINNKKHKYRFKNTYKIKDDENFVLIDRKIRLSLTKSQSENLGKWVKASNYGNIIDSYDRILTDFYIFNGNYMFNCMYVHNIVAHAHLDNPMGYTQAKHIDGNLLNNNVSNLKWDY